MKKRTLLSILCVFVLVGILIIAFTKYKEKSIKIPYITFMENHNREKCLFICSDGRIFTSTSEEAFLMSFEELDEAIQQNRYEDVVRLVGTTSSKKVRQMYRYFIKIVVKKRYYVGSKTNNQPASKVRDKKVRYWRGVVYDNDGVMTDRLIFESNSDMLCSDVRGYKIVNWMYDTLEEYFAEEGKAAFSNASGTADHD